jgi:hypothetical protein
MPKNPCVHSIRNKYEYIEQKLVSITLTWNPKKSRKWNPIDTPFDPVMIGYQVEFQNNDPYQGDQVDEK